MANDLESNQFRQLLLESLNDTVEIVTNFSSITGEIVQIEIFNIPLDYVVIKEAEQGFVYIPLFAIDALILVQEEGDLQ
ncbi:hypothetical protein [Priestia megaterium]|uniref:hypothetical protein n=1 Tax=Priestia megaterium TaxID=1404 RepID=UPI003459FC44